MIGAGEADGHARPPRIGTLGASTRTRRMIGETGRYRVVRLADHVGRPEVAGDGARSVHDEARKIGEADAGGAIIDIIFGELRITSRYRIRCRRRNSRVARDQILVRLAGVLRDGGGGARGSESGWNQFDVSHVLGAGARICLKRRRLADPLTIAATSPAKVPSQGAAAFPERHLQEPNPCPR